MYVNTTAEVKAETDYCVTSSNAVAVVEHIMREHGPDVDILFGPDMFLGAYVEKMVGRKMKVWVGECHVHAGIRPSDIAAGRPFQHPTADFLIHPECGCSTSVMEYVASGDVDHGEPHMLSTGGMLDHVKKSDASTFIVATETGMLHPLEEAGARTARVRAGQPSGSLRVHEDDHADEAPRRAPLRRTNDMVKVDPAIAEKARIPIERMVAVNP